MSAVVIARARPIELWPPVPSTFSEADLLPVVRVEMCACGERIRQLLGDSVQATVAAHVAGECHQAWREARS